MRHGAIGQGGSPARYLEGPARELGTGQFADKPAPSLTTAQQLSDGRAEHITDWRLEGNGPGRGHGHPGPHQMLLS